jgi:hypothetical protein
VYQRFEDQIHIHGIPLLSLSPHKHQAKLGQGYCDDSGVGVRTQSYDFPTHIKYVKHLVYVWSGSGMSMKGMGGPNHILQHVPSENPTENPTTGPPPFRVRHSMVLWHSGHPPHIKYVKHLSYVWSGSGMSMRWMGGPNHILQHVPSENPTEVPTTVPMLTWSIDMTIRYAKVHLIYDFMVIYHIVLRQVVHYCGGMYMFSPSCTCIQDNSPWCRRWVSVGSYDWGPPSLHTHSRSTSYTYKEFKHLELWLVVIRMLPHPYICPLRPDSGSPWCRRWVSISSYDWGPPSTSYS